MVSVSDFSTFLVNHLTGDYLYAEELQAFWMAFQGAMAVKRGPNKNGNMAWFHAFLLTIISGYGGGLFGNILMGRPTSMLSNDVNIGSCILAFLVVNYTPYDIGFKLGNTLPIVLVTTTFAQLFRSLGIVKFTTAAHEAFKDNPSAYYPIPVFGPIMNGTLLGNMGSLFLKGFDGYLEKGMPWAFQNGLFCATFYHFFVHDEKGPIGMFLRRMFHTYLCFLQGDLDDKTLAICFVGFFMQIMGILQIFYGPGFSPFEVAYDYTVASVDVMTKATAPLAQKIVAVESTTSAAADGGAATTSSSGDAVNDAKKRKRKKKKKAAANGGNGSNVVEKDKDL